MRVFKRKGLGIYTIEQQEDSTVKNLGFRGCTSIRYIVVALGFSIFFVLNTQRLNISIAIISMVNSTSRMGCEHRRENTSMEYAIETASQRFEEVCGEFDWNAELQGYILGAGYIGYVVTQVPGGRLAEILGAKMVLILGLLISSVCNLITPFASRWNVYALIAAQLIKGLGQGALQPAMSLLMANWFPSTERGFLSSIVFSGMPVGAFVAGTVSGVICNSAGGWPLVFYVSGVFGCLCCLLLQCYLYDQPEQHPKISENELEYILMNIKTSLSASKRSIPWCSMILSVPTWALTIAMFGQCWMAYYFLSVHPTYMGTILHFHITENGILSSAPYILQAFVTWSASYISDWLRRRNFASQNFVRKSNNTAGCVGFSLCLLGVYFAQHDKQLNVLLFVVAMGCIGFGFPGSLIVPVDMSPNFAGTLMGVTNSIGNISGFLVPVVVGTFTSRVQNVDQWRKVFVTSILVSWFSGAIFIFFGSADVQAWNNTPSEPSERCTNTKETTCKDTLTDKCPEFSCSSYL